MVKKSIRYSHSRELNCMHGKGLAQAFSIPPSLLPQLAVGMHTLNLPACRAHGQERCGEQT